MLAGTRIGHVHLNVADLTAAEAFYPAALGFDITVRGYPGALFPSAGGYHHHVGLNTGGRGRPSPPSGSRGLEYFEVSLPVAQLAAEEDRLREAGSRAPAARTTAFWSPTPRATASSPPPPPDRGQLRLAPLGDQRRAGRPQEDHCGDRPARRGVPGEQDDQIDDDRDRHQGEARFRRSPSTSGPPFVPGAASLTCSTRWRIAPTGFCTAGQRRVRASRSNLPSFVCSPWARPWAR